jgi:sphinganine-1-phosphate aldolase
MPGVSFPQVGRSWQAVEADIDQLSASDAFLNPKNRLMAAIHKGDEVIYRVSQAAYNKVFHVNAFVFDMGEKVTLGKMQSDVLQWTVSLLNGGADARASMMVGGSESIFCALHAAREWAKANRPKANAPYEIILPWSAHPAFDKAAHYLCMKTVRVPLGSDLRADVPALSAAITPNTVMVVGSAPSWGFGLVDPIADIGKIAEQHGLWMHVDACVGGFLLPFIEEVGIDVPVFDFRVPAVCSISADLHKHGYSAKPASTISFRSEQLRQYNYIGVAIEDWQSGLYLTHGVIGSRPAGAVASAWAVISTLGAEGYMDITRRALVVKQRLIDGIESIEDFKVLRNHTLFVPFRSETLDMMKVFGGLVECGYIPWGTTSPMYVHPSAEAVDDTVVDSLLNDIRTIGEGVRNGIFTADAMASYSH